MAWNQPGSDNRDPWGQGNGQNGPPDLDDLIKDLQKKFAGILGGGGKKPGGGGSGRARSIGGRSILFIVLILIGLWGATGFYVVEQGEQGVETQIRPLPAGHGSRSEMARAIPH